LEKKIRGSVIFFFFFFKLLFLDYFYFVLFEMRVAYRLVLAGGDEEGPRGAHVHRHHPPSVEPAAQQLGLGLVTLRLQIRHRDLADVPGLWERTGSIEAAGAQM
jgi:hypothetical protein